MNRENKEMHNQIKILYYLVLVEKRKILSCIEIFPNQFKIQIYCGTKPNPVLVGKTIVKVPGTITITLSPDVSSFLWRKDLTPAGDLLIKLKPR